MGTVLYCLIGFVGVVAAAALSIGYLDNIRKACVTLLGLAVAFCQDWVAAVLMEAGIGTCHACDELSGGAGFICLCHRCYL